MKSSKKRGNKRKIILITVLMMLCLLAGAWLLLFEQPAGRHIAESSEQAARIGDSIETGISQLAAETEQAAAPHLEKWMAAEHVYPHGHTGRDDEHTFAAYDAALEAGAHFVEPDVVISGDGTLYVSHDLDAGRITGVSRSFSGMSDAEIDELRGRTDEPIHRLSDVFERYGDEVKYLVELKSSDDATVGAFRDEVDGHNLAERIVLQSEFPEVLEKSEDIYPDMPKMLIVKNDAAFNLAISADYIDIVGARVQFMTEGYCDAAHEAGRMFAGWPIDSESEITNAIRIGADAYFTNDTALAIELERKYRKAGLKFGGSGNRSGNAKAKGGADNNNGSTKEEVSAAILFASDYQAEDGFDSPAGTLSAVLESAASDGSEPDMAVLCGDYTNDASLHDYQLSGEDSIVEIRETLSTKLPDLDDEDMLFVQGNHDAMTESIAASGLHEYDDYLVYVLNTESDFPWKQGKVAGCRDKVTRAAKAMKKCFGELIERGETRPVFIAGHVPLHFTARTSSRHTTGDNLYSSLIFDAVNDAGKSLDIVYLYGHNHSKGWDCYLGGACVYKAVGDSLLIPQFSGNEITSDRFEERKLNFTYLNAGYVGYYMNCAPDEYSRDPDSPYRAADETLSCTVCEVYPDRIEISRYDKDGVHSLGAAGEGDPYKGGIDAGLIDSGSYSDETTGPAVIYRKTESIQTADRYEDTVTA